MLDELELELLPDELLELDEPELEELLEELPPPPPPLPGMMA